MLKKIYEWKEKIETNELLVRDIIDIDSTYEDFEAIDEEEKKVKAEAKSKKIKTKTKKMKMLQQLRKKMNSTFPLQKWREEIDLRIIKIIDNLTKDYLKLQKYQREKLDCILASKELSIQKIKILKKFNLH